MAETKNKILNSELILTKLDQGMDLHENLVDLHEGLNRHSKIGLMNKTGCIDIEASSLLA